MRYDHAQVTTEAVIGVRSQRRALEWSLVLASQGIETSIGAPDETRGWHLLVAAQDHARALEILREYRLENRPHRWVHRVPGTGLVFDGSSLAWVITLAVFYWLDAERSGQLRLQGMMDSEAVRAGAWWRLFTAILLHGDLGHLAANLTTGFLLIGLAMGTLGVGLGLLGSFLAGAGGNLVGLLVYSGSHRSLGASGMVLGALGLLTAQPILLGRASGTRRQVILRSLWGGLLLLVLLGFSPHPETDVIAHVGGFAWGLGLGMLFLAVPERLRQSRWTHTAAVLLCLALVLYPWWKALRISQ